MKNIQKSEMYLAMCLRYQLSQPDCVYKLGVYKKKCVYSNPSWKQKSNILDLGILIVD